jgi:diguanylate cyclase (GGDEF)-like protein
MATHSLARTPIRVLIVDGSTEMAAMLLKELKRGPFDVHYRQVSTADELKAALDDDPWDIALAGAEHEELRAKTAIQLLRENGAMTPVVVVATRESAEGVADGIKYGAQDYIRPGQLRRLIPIIQRTLEDAAMRQRPEDILLHEAYHDSLTGLPNRILFDYRLRQALQRARGARQVVGVLSIDLDSLKNVNHIYSHSVGDLLLQHVAQRLRSCLGPNDVLARLGGDEFLMMTAGETVENSKLAAQQVLDSIRLPFVCGGHEVYLTASVGVTFYPIDGADPDTLLRNAESALDRVKQEGKNSIQLYTSSMTSNAVRRVTLENSLRRALQKKEFVIHYQPQLDMRSGAIVGLEALVRWQVPDYGLVPPAEFIPIAEETGLIVPIGEWVLRTACAQTKLWHESGFPQLSIAVNLSARQFQQQDLVERIEQILKETRIAPDALELEITESYAMQNADYTISVLTQLKKRGIRVSIDDFGTGYSSLSYLKQFPIDTLKIDRSFVKDLATDANDAAIAAAIIVLAHSLKLQVIAEGVETQAELDILKRHACDKMQGYFFSRPIPVKELEALLHSKKTLSDISMDSMPGKQ